MVEINGYAKINLFLDIQSKRLDGYHNIISVMQAIDWHDKIKISQTDCSGIKLQCTEHEVPVDQKNTAYKAASLFLDAMQSSCGVNIVIEKNIPLAAGLAGGSADAAAVLIGLNELFGHPLSNENLLLLGGKIGADVPFCMTRGTRLTTGIGDKIESFPAISNCFIVCAKMGDGVSTPQAYRCLDEMYDDFANYRPRQEKLLTLSKAIEACDLELLSQGIYNIFERPVEEARPFVTSLKKLLREYGAKAAMMSGSGPSVFGIFSDKAAAKQACNALCDFGAKARICVPVQ